MEKQEKLNISLYSKHRLFQVRSKNCENRLQSNLPKTERDRSGIFFPPVFIGFRFTKGCVLIKQSTKKYDRLGLQ